MFGAGDTKMTQVWSVSSRDLGWEERDGGARMKMNAGSSRDPTRRPREGVREGFLEGMMAKLSFEE